MNKIIQTNITDIGDPAILIEDGTYFMFATYPGSIEFHCYSSTDGKTFKDEGIALDGRKCFGIDRFWAPEVIKYHGKYLMFYSAGAKDGLMHIQVAESSSIKGPYKDLSKNPLLSIPGKSTIDAHCFIDDDDQKYLYFSLDCSTNVIDGKHISQIHCVKISDDFRHIISEPVLISSPTREWELYSGPEWFWNEGPYILKHNGKYFLTYSTNYYCSKHYSVGCRVSDNPLGPFEYMQDSPILDCIEGEISGPGHNAFFIGLDGKLKIAFHIHTFIDEPSGNRRACWCDAHFEKDKLIIDYK